MTCFWDGIMHSLDNSDKDRLGLANKNSIYSLIECLQKRNIKTKNVYWQGMKLTDMQLKENMEHIRLYNRSSAPGGYLCSTCDPFLILLCELLEKNINHFYLGNKIMYENRNNSKQTYNYKCNTGHFWFSNKN